MATEKINLTAPEGPVGTIAEDAPTTSENTTSTTNNDTEIDAEVTQMSENFADEEAALAADEAGLDIGEETAEEEAAPSSSDDLNGLSKTELVALFAQKIESEPVQTLRSTVEAIKIAFYK